VEGIILSML